MAALPFPIPPPPITRPGGWDPTRDAPNNTTSGPTLGQVWKQIKEAAGVEDDAKAQPRVEASDTDCAQTSDQNQCNACKLAQGFIIPARYTIPLPQYRNFDYQLRIANHLAGPERFDYTYGGTKLDRTRLKFIGGKNEISVSEWSYGGIRFDGFWRSRCTVIEAKGHYKQFFKEDGRLHFWATLNKDRPNILQNWKRQVAVHDAHILRLGPPAKLEWHFLEVECFMAAVREFGPFSNRCRYTP